MSSPAVTWAVAQATVKIRLASAVTVLSTADPVRVHQDFASLDLVSGGRAEIIAGRSAFAEPFGLFGVDLSRCDEIFAEKLDLLLALRASDRVTWSGRFRPPLADAEIASRPVQPRLPVWLGVGGSPGSAVRAGRLGLPMVAGLIGGTFASARRTVDIYPRPAKRPGTRRAGSGSA